jgi:hypothetical protein
LNPICFYFLTIFSLNFFLTLKKVESRHCRLRKHLENSGKNTNICMVSDIFYSFSVSEEVHSNNRTLCFRSGKTQLAHTLCVSTQVYFYHLLLLIIAYQVLANINE